MLNRELEVTLNLAFKEARSKRHEFMTVEHLLLALLDNEAAATVLRACGANLDKLKHDLQEFIDSTTPLIPVHDEDRETQPTLGFQRVLQRAVCGLFTRDIAETKAMQVNQYARESQHPLLCEIEKDG